MELKETILRRRSSRSYLTESIEENELNSILEAGLLAPSSRNLKSTEFITVTGKEQLSALSRVKAAGGGMLKGASHAIVVIGDSARSDAWIEDGSIAMTQMMLQATELGIANCWVQIRNRGTETASADANTKALLGIPESYSILAILSLGYPTEDAVPHTAADADWSKVHRGSF